MIATRKLITVLLLGVAASSHAFKPSNKLVRSTSSNGAVSFSPDEVPEHVFKSSRGIARGGDSEGILNIQKSDVVKLHGMTTMFFAAVFLLETLGVKVPLVGPTDCIPGFDGDNGALKFITRFMASCVFGVGLYEIEYASNGAEIFNKYHLVASAVTLWTMKEIGGQGLQWQYPVLVTLFTIAGLVAK